MEDITLERLLSDFRGVLDQINDIIERRDIEQAIEALNQIKELVYSEQNVQLDEGVEQGYDHILHQLLSQISGVIEIERDGTAQELGETQVITVAVIQEEIIRVEEEIARLRLVETTTSVNREEVLELIEGKTRRLEFLRNEMQRRFGVQLESVGQSEEQNQNEINEERDRLNSEIADLEERLQRAVRARKEEINSGNESEEAIANAEYSSLVEEISTRRHRLTELENSAGQQNGRNEENNENAAEIESLNNEIADLGRKLQEATDAMESGKLSGQAFEERLNELLNELNNLSRRQNGRSVEDNERNQELDNLQAELQRLENERRTIEEEYNRILNENNGGQNWNTRNLYIEQERITKEISSVTAKIIGLTTRTAIRDGDGDGDRGENSRLDLEEKAKLIGDKIFKTARIRSELQERDISREEFLDFYNAGIAREQDELQRLDILFDEFSNLFGSITNSQSGENLYDQLSKCENIEEENERNSEKIRILEEIRKNFIGSKKFEKELREHKFFDKEITTIEEAERFNNEFFSKFEENAVKMLKDFKTKRDEHKENIEIYNQEISRIKDEQRNIEMAQNSFESLKEEEDKEKALRERQIRATIFGDPDLEKEWSERVRRFYSHKVEGRKTIQTPEGTHSINYSSIEDYPEYNEDAHFLNLDDYKKYLEITTLYENSGKNIDFMLQILDEATVAEYNRKEAKQEGSGRKWLEDYLADKAEYVSTFHGFTNEHGVKYTNYKTAGSSLKMMKPVKGDLPAKTKVGNAVGNTFRFFGLRKPEFNRIDEHGNKVSNVAGGLLTIATDALVVGGVTAGILTGPVGWATLGSAYAVRGGVLAGNRIAARNYYKKHKEEIDNNLPTLGNPSKDDKEVARKDYYRRVEGKNRFTSWLKAKNDRFFFRKRAEDTENKIVDERVELSNSVIDARGSDARKQALKNVETANRNQEKRQENTRRAIRSQDFYNQVVRDPDSLNLDEALAESARTGALKSHNQELAGSDVNPNSSEPIGTKYQREEEQYEKTNDMGRIRTKGDTISATAVTVEEKYTARQQKQDRINKILTIIGTSAARLGIEYLRTGFTEQHVIKSKNSDEVMPGKTTQKPVYKNETVTQLDGNKRLSDLQYDDDALNDVWNDPSTIPHEHYVRGDDPIRAFTIRATGADGKIKEVSIAQNGYGIIPGRHVYYGVDQDVSNLTVTEAIDLLKSKMPVQFDEYCKAVGLEGASSEEIARHAIENGNMFGQTGTMAGWEKILPSNLTHVTRKVLDHMETVTTPETTIPGAVRRTVTTVFNPNAVVDATLQGIAGGAAVGVVDQLHEAAKQTKKVNPGTFEKRTPSLLLSRIARREQEKLNKKIEAEREKDEHQTGRNRRIKSANGKKAKEYAESLRLYKKYREYYRNTNNPLSFEDWKKVEETRGDSER